MQVEVAVNQQVQRTVPCVYVLQKLQVWNCPFLSYFKGEVILGVQIA